MGVPRVSVICSMTNTIPNWMGAFLSPSVDCSRTTLKLLIYPLLDRNTGNLTTVQNLEVAPELRKLYSYLVDKGCIEQLDNFNPENLSTFSREVLRMIQTGDQSWSKHVPAEVAEVIQRRGFFGYRRAAPAKESSTVMVPNCIGQLPFTPGCVPTT